MSPSCFCCFMLLLFLKFFSNYCKHKTSLNEKNANIIQNKSRIATKCPLLRHTANKHTNTTSQVIIQRGWSQCFLLNTQDLCIKHNINWSNHILLNFFKYRSTLAQNINLKFHQPNQHSCCRISVVSVKPEAQ